jgi:hypothetical protein
MQKESAIIDLLSAQQRAWRAHFPSLSNRAHQTIIGYLCTRGRSGVPVRQIYGVTKELYLLDDATVRERVEEIDRQGLCEATPKESRLTGRTIVVPTETLLATFDAYLLAVAEEIRGAMQHIDASLTGPGPVVLHDRDRTTILQVFDAYALAWLAGADQFLIDQKLSPARRTEARRRLTSTSYWVLMHRVMEHADHLRRGLVTEDTLVADQLAADVLDLTGQSFQTIRDHISWLISQSLMDRAPGRVLRVSLAAAAARYFDDALRQAAAEAADAAQRLGMAQVGRTLSWPQPAIADGSLSDQTIRMKMPGEDGADGHIPPVLHWLEVISPTAAATRVALSETPVVIGRARPANLLLPDGAVSRTHCQVAVAGAEVTVTDLGSTNGTFVDGQRIEGSTALPEGGMLRIGPYSLTYKRETTL